MGLLAGASEDLKDEAFRKALVTLRSQNAQAYKKWFAVFPPTPQARSFFVMCSSKNQRVSFPSAGGQIDAGAEVLPVPQAAKRRVQPRISMGQKQTARVVS